MSFSPTLSEAAGRLFRILPTLLFDLFLLWVLVRFGLGGWERAYHFYSRGPSPWGMVLILVAMFALLKSNFRNDVPMFISAFALSYWLEWWGTTRGLWSYVTNETPPMPEIYLWGVFLVSIYHAHLLFRARRLEEGRSRLGLVMRITLLALPGAALVLAWKTVFRGDWTRFVDVHSLAAIPLVGFLIIKDFDLEETFWIFLCGALLGGTLEYLGTGSGRYAYVTGGGLPLFVPPLWGATCVIMVKFGHLVRNGTSRALSFGRSRCSSWCSG